MGIKKLSFIGWLLLASCNTQENLKQLPQGEIPYQRYVADGNTEVLLFIYDSWGIENNIFVKENDTIYCARFEVDPIPIVKLVRHDTIFLEYHNYSSQGNGVVCKQSIYEWARNVGPYTIVNCKHYDLAGSVLRQRTDVDSININGIQITLYQNGDSLLDISLNDIVFKKADDGDYNICVSSIDTINWLKNSYYYTVDAQLLSSFKTFQ